MSATADMNLGHDGWVQSSYGPSPDIAQVASILADNSRTAMLSALMDGRAWTVGELARAAKVRPSTASEHVRVLVDAEWCVVAPRGRHRYIRLASREAAQLIEALGVLAGRQVPQPASLSRSIRDTALSQARTCYRHLAGRLGVAIADSLIEAGHLRQWQLTESGYVWCHSLGIDTAPGRSGSELVRPCMDWTERVDHLGGLLADRMCTRLFELGWIKRRPNDRGVTISVRGREQLAHHGVSLEQLTGGEPHSRGRQ